MTTLRPDIQALRGIAVLAVVLFHLQLVPTPGGYLGVDIFFVISGYLITLMVADGIAARTFRLRDFYTRRAKRLLPAAYATVFATALVAPWLLNQRELRDFAFQVVGTATFSSNFVLWRQTGYFEGASELKPLLHTWSLAVEEQYYLLLPGLLLLMRPSNWGRVVLIALGTSAVLCAFGSFYQPEATFYLIPSRAWELLIGSAGALLVHRHGGAGPGALQRVLGWTFWPALFGVFAVLFHPLGGPHPGPDAAIVCICTLVLILRRHPAAGGWGVTKLLAWVGDLSYSLYLVHWPLVALLKNAWVGPEGELPSAFRVALFATAMLLSWAMYRQIENPVRRSRWQFTPLRVVALLGVSAALMTISPIAYYATKSSVDYAALRGSNFGLGRSCLYNGPFEPVRECQTNGTPKIIVWGDSFAMHVVPGLARQSSTLGGVIQATRSVCGPLIDVAPIQKATPAGGPSYDADWARRCQDFNREVVNHIVQSPDIRTVVMSSPLVQYQPRGNWLTMVDGDSGIRVEAPTVLATADAFRRTADALRAAGKKVIFVAPPPAAGFNIGACLERLHTGRLTLGAFPRCEIPIDAYRQWRGEIVEMVDAIERAGLPVLRLAPFLCDAAKCRTELDGVFLYNDEAHLSVEGSRLLAERMDWARVVIDGAR